MWCDTSRIMASARLEYIAAGGNRHPCAADWTEELLAYGSGHNIAIWRPENNDHKGVETLLTGHLDIVNAVKLFKDAESGKRIIISGSADRTICIWIEQTDGKFEFARTLI